MNGQPSLRGVLVAVLVRARRVEDGDAETCHRKEVGVCVSAKEKERNKDTTHHTVPSGKTLGWSMGDVNFIFGGL